jgi:hypothetical protein
MTVTSLTALNGILFQEVLNLVLLLSVLGCCTMLTSKNITNILGELLASILKDLKEVLGIPGSLLGEP